MKAFKFTQDMRAPPRRGLLKAPCPPVIGSPALNTIAPGLEVYLCSETVPWWVLVTTVSMNASGRQWGRTSSTPAVQATELQIVNLRSNKWLQSRCDLGTEETGMITKSIRYATHFASDHPIKPQASLTRSHHHDLTCFPVASGSAIPTDTYRYLPIHTDIYRLSHPRPRTSRMRGAWCSPLGRLLAVASVLATVR